MALALVDELVRTKVITSYGEKILRRAIDPQETLMHQYKLQEYGQCPKCLAVTNFDGHECAPMHPKIAEAIKNGEWK